MEPEKNDIRILAYDIGTAIGYSFILTVIITIVSLIVKGFYPPSPFEINPIEALFVSPAEGIVQFLVLAFFIIFTLPTRSMLEKFSLIRVRKIAIYAGVGYLIFSLLPYVFIIPYLQAYIGLVIIFNVLNGVVGGFFKYIYLKREFQSFFYY